MQRSLMVIWHTIGCLLVIMILGGLIITGPFKNSDEAWNVFAVCFMGVSIVALPIAVVAAMNSYRKHSESALVDEATQESDADEGRD